MRRILKDFLTEDTKKSPIIEFDFLLLSIVGDLHSDPMTMHLSPHLKLYEYDRYLSPNGSDRLWREIASVLQRSTKPYAGVAKIGESWVAARKTRLLSSKNAYERVRIIDSNYFEFFKQNPHEIYAKHLSHFNNNPIKKNFLLNRLNQIKNLQSFERFNMSLEILKNVRTYAEKRLLLINQSFKTLNSQFYNVHQVNLTHLLLLIRESLSVSENNRAFDNDLISLSLQTQKLIENYLYFPVVLPINNYLQRLKNIDERITAAKYDSVNGISAYDAAKNTFQLRAHQSDFEKRLKKDTHDCKVIIASWIRLLKARKLRNIFVQFVMTDKVSRIDAKISLRKRQDQLKIAKKIYRLKLCSPRMCHEIIADTKKLVDQHYSSLEALIANPPSTDDPSKLAIFYKDMENVFRNKTKQSIFNREIKASIFLKNIYDQHLKNVSKLLYEEAVIKHQISVSIDLQEHFKKEHLSRISKSKFACIPFAKTRLEKSIHMIKAIQLLEKFYHSQTTYFIKHYQNLFLRSNNVLVFSTAYTKILNWKEISLTYSELDFKKRTANGLPKPYFSMASRFTLVNEIINKRYQVALEEMKLFVKGIVHFPSLRTTRKKIALGWRRKIREHFNTSLISSKDNFIAKLFAENNNLEELNDDNWSKNIISFDPYKQYESKKMYCEFLSSKLTNLIHQKNDLKCRVKSYKKDIRLQQNIAKNKFKDLISKIRLLYNIFKKNSMKLLKNIQIVNQVALKTNMVVNKKAINESEFTRTFETNIYILKRHLWLMQFLNKATSLKWFFNQQRCLEYFNQFEVSKKLIDVGLNEFYLFTSPETFDNSDFLRLYLGIQFLVNPKVLIYCGLPLNSQHEKNFVKGLLVGEQNQQGFAMIFLESTEPESKKVCTWTLPKF
ncbi:hypothetical protein [[Mycoplasma] testudinis]|uniref:hypothetical protein n=1 Tax=[Mycoplasma] testudinis TaxID=33924 RepID=UPI0004877642|nr:hypothetical protein [[Mycoplasma] testudinis]